MSSARERAEAALAATEEERIKREAEERRRQEQRDRDALIKRQSAEMLVTARAELMRALEIDATDWDVVESHPTYAVLMDPDDKAYHKLSLIVTNWGAKVGELVIRYAPYDSYGKNYTNNRQGDGMNWHCGPVITNLVDLGKALAKHEAEQAYHDSMPAHLP